MGDFPLPVKESRNQISVHPKLIGEVDSGDILSHTPELVRRNHHL